MIEDFPQDIKASQAAGIKTIAILGDTGKYTEDRIKQLNPDIILTSIHDLVNIFPSLI